MLEIGKNYTGEQLKRLLTPERARELQAQGMVLEMDAMSGLYHLTHFTSAAGVRGSELPKTGTGGFAPLDPIEKRSPQERVNSLMLRFMEDCKAAGTVPGLDDMRISWILGEAWKTGMSQITGEHIRTIAAHYLQKAENEKAAADYKRTVTPSPNA